MKIVALLTGRGNNTLADKNVMEVKGKPLLYYPSIAAKNAADVNYLYVSSDDDKILTKANEIGYKKILRPDELATPTSKHIDSIFHALDFMKENDNLEPDILIVLLANSATVKTEWINEGIKMIKDDPSISSVVPVYQEQDHHPYRAKTLDSNGNLVPFFDFGDKEISTNRQELSPCYFLCHNFWILNVKNSIYKEGGQKPWVFLGDNIKPIIVEDSFDIHTLDDVKRTEKWLEKNLGL